MPRVYERLLDGTVESIHRHCVENENGCLIWQRSTSPRGYGTCYRGTYGEQLVHRLVWKWTYGDISADLTIDHLCYEPGCQNVEHMRLVTASENSKGVRRIIEQRNRTHCPRGHPYDESNTYYERNGGRKCRICTNAYTRRWSARKKGTV